MNAKHRRTLAALRAKEVPKNLPFRDIESLLRAIGCAVIECEGSRVLFKKGAAEWSTHRPHPGKEAYPIHVKGARRILLKLEAIA